MQLCHILSHFFRDRPIFENADPDPGANKNTEPAGSRTATLRVTGPFECKSIDFVELTYCNLCCWYM